jgi:hypothetical protein
MKIKSFSIAFILLLMAECFSQKVGNSYALNINNIYLPLDRRGVLADVDGLPFGSGGQFGGFIFLFSGGFFLSGYSNGQLWANAVASATLVTDYLQGVVGGENDPNAVLYRVGGNDVPFGQSWQDWIDAVDLGAVFYDGDNNGIYNPVDLNSNGLWDTNEDCPDILGDEMLWCVFHDGVPVPIRRWNTSFEVGMEVRQTVFAYSSSPYLENVIFIRYRFKYAGLGLPGEPDILENIYFGTWDDPDLGDSMDDLVGCDTLLQGGYTYNDGSDPVYGNNPPGFLAKLLAGPVVYIPGETFIDINGNGKYDEGIDTPLDTAYIHRGQILGIEEYPGAKNKNLSSAIEYINGDLLINDPSNINEARNYMLGLTRTGMQIDPCSWNYGQVLGGVPCSEVNPMFWYSGDRVINRGWINIYAADKRQMQNIGPFDLEKGKEFEVFVAYNVGQGTSAISSITEVKNISIQSQGLYDLNFDPSGLPVWLEEITGENLPADFNLYQNYPNPFNPATTLSFVIGHQSFVTLKVYDVLGNEIATLVNEELSPGEYEIDFNPSSGIRDIASGIYFYTLKAGGFIQTKKMVYLK